MMVHAVATLYGWSVVAVTPPTAPAETGPPVSVTSVLTRPEPLPLSVLRTVWLAGAVQAVTTDDLAVQ